MERQFKAMIVLLVALVLGACGGKGGESDEDATDVPDVEDVTDGTTDTGPDVELDVEPDVEPDAADVVEDEGPECIPGSVGSPPSEAMDACMKAGGCITLPDSGEGGFMEFCVMRSFFEIIPIYAEPMELFGVGMFLDFFDDVDANTACIAAAADCDGVFRCLNGGADSPACSLPDPGMPVWGDSCTDDVLDLCMNVEQGTTNGRIIQHDCSADGLSCVTLGAIGAGCMQTDCATAGDPTCDGDDVDYCILSGAHMVFDCDEMSHGAGGTCGDVDPSTGDVEVGCVPSGAACDPLSDTPYCTAQRLHECDPDFEQWIRIDCTDIGTDWGCEESSGVGDCVPDITGWTCTLSPEPECDCDDVILCDPFAGSDLRIHCPDYDLRTCGDTDPVTPEVDVGCIE
jgi:predicted small lipoprotein YifL